MYIISVGSPFECCALESYLLTLRVKLFEHHGKAAVYFIVVGYFSFAFECCVRQVGFFFVFLLLLLFFFFTFHNNDRFFHWFSFKLMESGVLGAVGQSALRLVEMVTKSENEPALIQPLQTVVVDAKDQTISRRAVTVNCAQVRKDTSYSRFSNT